MAAGERIEVLVTDSITRITRAAAGAVVVAGSHGGLFPAYLAATCGLRGVILNDAGVGLDDAGIACLAYLDTLGTAAATISHASARIGDGTDMMARGVISHANPRAVALGCAVGQACAEAAAMLRGGGVGNGDPPPYVEGRFLLRVEENAPLIYGLDSIALAAAGDAGSVLVIGSHGALLAGDPETAIGVQALAVVFHDAGIGIDRAGVSRLPVLGQRGIAAATVSAASARIGDARSMWTHGRLSVINGLAAAQGANVGMSLPEFADCMVADYRRGKTRRVA